MCEPGARGTLVVMTSSDTLDDMATPAPGPAAQPPRRLRRVHEGRIGAGVAAGLGRYFGLDPVLFRVLFATSAFFGGAGVIAYLIGWAAIPDERTEHAAVDGWFDALRRRRVPLWVVTVVGGFLLWSVAFSWWAPGRFLPVLAVIVLVLFFITRREGGPAAPDWSEPAPAAGTTPVDLRKHPAEEPTAPNRPVPGAPTWVADGRSWFDDARAAGRARRRRAHPVRVATLCALVLAFTCLGIADAITGIAIQAYFWTGLVIVVLGLLGGLALRRTPVSLALLALPFAVGAIAFAGSPASFSDGIGQRQWTPTGAPASQYRLAIGQGVLDLRSMDPATKPVHIDVTMGAGRTLIILPTSMKATVDANVQFGHITADDGSGDHDGVGTAYTVKPPAGATGQPVTIDVHLSDGEIAVDRR